MATNRQYDHEFKVQAIKLAQDKEIRRLKKENLLRRYAACKQRLDELVLDGRLADATHAAEDEGATQCGLRQTCHCLVECKSLIMLCQVWIYGACFPPRVVAIVVVN